MAFDGLIGLSYKANERPDLPVYDLFIDELYN